MDLAHYGFVSTYIEPPVFIEWSLISIYLSILQKRKIVKWTKLCNCSGGVGKSETQCKETHSLHWKEFIWQNISQSLKGRWIPYILEMSWNFSLKDEKDSIEKVFKSCTWERCHSCLKSSLTLLKYCWLQSENSWVTHTSWQTRCDKLFLQKEKLTFDSRVKRDTFAVKDDYVSYPSRVHFFDL